MSERVLITGGAGYLGSILTPALLAEGFHVTVLDAFRFGEASLLECCANPNFDVVHGDCRDQKTVRDAIRRADYILPLAAIVGAPACAQDAVGTQSVNLDAVKLVLALRAQGQRVIFPCTNSGYGVGEKGKFCTEETPAAADQPVRANQGAGRAGRAGRRPTARSFRLATVFGVSPRMRTGPAGQRFRLPRGDGPCRGGLRGPFQAQLHPHPRRGRGLFLHGIANFDTMKGRPYNVGLERRQPFQAGAVRRIKQSVPGFVYLEAPIGEDPDKRDYIVSNARIEGTGYRPQHSIEMGICELQKAFRILRARRYANV